MRGADLCDSQLDFLEHPSVNDVVVLTTVLEEVRRPCLSSPVLALSDFASPTASQVRRRNSSAYTRLRALCSSPSRRFFVFANEHREETYVTATPGETPNDRNDRAIRVAAKWCVRGWPGGLPAVGWVGA